MFFPPEEWHIQAQAKSHKEPVSLSSFAKRHKTQPMECLSRLGFRCGLCTYSCGPRKRVPKKTYMAKEKIFPKAALCKKEKWFFSTHRHQLVSASFQPASQDGELVALVTRSDLKKLKDFPHAAKAQLTSAARGTVTGGWGESGDPEDFSEVAERPVVGDFL